LGLVSESLAQELVGEKGLHCRWGWLADKVDSEKYGYYKYADAEEVVEVHEFIVCG